VLGVMGLFHPHKPTTRHTNRADPHENVRGNYPPPLTARREAADNTARLSAFSGS